MERMATIAMATAIITSMEAIVVEVAFAADLVALEVEVFEVAIIAAEVIMV